MSLLLDSGTELHQVFRNGLVGSLEDVNQSTSETLLVVGEEGNGSTVLTSTTGTANAVNVVLDTLGC